MSLENAKQVLEWHGMDLAQRSMRICYELRAVEGTAYLTHFVRLCLLDLLENSPAPWNAEEWRRGFGPILRQGQSHPRWDAFAATVHGYNPQEWGFEAPAFIMRVYQYATLPACSQHVESVSYCHMRALTDLTGDANLQRRSRMLAYVRQFDFWRTLFFRPHSIADQDGLKLPRE